MVGGFDMVYMSLIYALRLGLRIVRLSCGWVCSPYFYLILRVIHIVVALHETKYRRVSVLNLPRKVLPVAEAMTSDPARLLLSFDYAPRRPANSTYCVPCIPQHPFSSEYGRGRGNPLCAVM